MTSPAEYEAALCQIEEDSPDIRQYNDNTREERWTHFSFEGVKFPIATVDVIQRREALAIFGRDLIIHFKQIWKVVALYAESWFDRDTIVDKVKRLWLSGYTTRATDGRQCQ